MLRGSHFTVTFGIRVCVGLEFELTSGYQRLLEISKNSFILHEMGHFG